MNAHGETNPRASSEETFNPWSIVSLVFHHLAAEGLHPVLGEAGDPGRPAADLLRALGVEPAAEGSRQTSAAVRDRLAELRGAVFAQSCPGPTHVLCLMLR